MKSKSFLPKHRFKIIDIFVVFLFVAALAGSFVWFRRPKSFVRVEIVAPIQDGKTAVEPYWVSNSIEIGDPVYDAFGNEIAKVVDVKNIDYWGMNRNVRISVDLQVLKDPKAQIYQFENQKLAIGSELSFVIRNTKFSGSVERITDREDNIDMPKSTQKRLLVRLLAQNIFPSQLQTYSPDFVVYDFGQHDIFRIVKVENIQDAPPQLIPNTLALTWNTTSHLKNAEIVASLEADCQNGVCYFGEEQPLKIGLRLNVQSNTSVITQAQIMDVSNQESTSSGELSK